jgi:hypothetical protein
MGCESWLTVLPPQTGRLLVHWELRTGRSDQGGGF